MVPGLFSVNELDFALGMGLSLVAGFLIGAERENQEVKQQGLEPIVLW
ncbi:hypothetical protein [Candidatus Nitrosocosmicus arcticus]|uniref:Uncharacterized protein n=1 Tax=Candidatus Nitrosocosmicus arcticus TaxID=2035267 RepID=A0A557SS39_9ARCH|nr:hypothetical protein [Candidatus Nitrosocosmicus arcticus]TVP39420.1 hypothetical protein NARC_150014 [Candidatus Nitrosocosmicus arcticus]